MENKLKMIIQAQLQNYHLDKIILFGSRARQDFSKFSDYDTLVILYDALSWQEKQKLTSKLRTELARFGIDLDIIIKSKKEVEYYKTKPGNIVRSALREGVAL